METFLKTLLGEMQLPVFLAYFTIAFLSALLALIIRANKKKDTTVNTPIEFSFKFFFHDNIQKLFVNILTIAFAIRFSNEIMGSEITGWISFLIGLGLNQLILWIENYQSKARS
jgi:hypothetical protein